MILFRQKVAIPDFLDSQRKSFRLFLETGIRRELEFISPIIGDSLGSSVRQSTDRQISVSFLSNDFYFKKPLQNPKEAIQQMETYSSSLVVPVHIYSKSLNVSCVLPITFCDLPLMTEHGTFIINGSPRVIVHQIVRCPGVYIKAQFDQKNRRSHLVSFLSSYGSWLRLESVPNTPEINACIDNFRKLPATLLLRALGFDFKRICEVVSYPASLLYTEKLLKPKSCDDAMIMMTALMFPHRAGSVLKAKKFLFNHFFHARRYSLSEVGRKRVNRKLRMQHNVPHLTLTPEDVLAGVDYLLRVENGESQFLDDIDHLKNRRARLAGELIQTQFRLGLNRLERSVHNRISDETLLRQKRLRVALASLVRTQIVGSVFKEFFGSNQLSQFMDQTNPLAEITHKRRLSSLGPGGLHRDRAGLIVRGIHPSYYGRICPIETPEGKNAGLVGSIATYARINSDGFLQTPYKAIASQKNQAQDGFFLLNASYEDQVVVAAADTQFSAARVPARTRREFVEIVPKTIDFLGLCPIQFMSIATALIPFLEHDDANRALMGSNMQRQAVSLLTPQRAFVGTGLEARVAHDSGAVARIQRSGYVLYADANRIDILTESDSALTSTPFTRETIWLTRYQRSNQDTCMHQRPSVLPNTWVHAGECLADTSSTVAGELALGKNILVAYMPWEGYNFEDAVLVSERLVFDDLFTSVHIERYDISTSRTREGQEYITSKVEKNTYLDAFGVVEIGTWVEPGDTLVGKISPQKESENTPEGRLLRAIFGGTARDVKDTPLTVPSGVTGRVLETRTLFETTLYNKQVECSESVGSVYVFLVQKRKVQVGDKIAGRHGNKGIISNILPRQDMPFLQNGTPVDMVLNPLGVPSRMNVGQIFECLLGLAAHTLEQNYKVLPFDEMHGDEVSRGFVYQQLYKARCATKQKWLFRPESPGKSILFDGRTGYPFDQPVTVGYPYILKLVHLVDDKIHARSTGPYSLVTQQPLGGRSKHGGQRLGEMEVWALEGFGAAYTLQELLTIKSDDMRGRNLAFMSIIRGNLLPKPGVPESFKVLVCELRGLCLDISLARIPSV
jgi:DNA-directed RNA polymerase subunit beta|tara:strand:- start:7249 stop:10470 length:3222 start_codon:yes stop_codon:yes gene_type:complete